MPLLPRPVRLVNGLPRRDRRDLPPAFDVQQELGYVWEKSNFTVPANIPDERVQFVADRYRDKFGAHLAGKGFEVLRMDGPYEDHSVIAAGITPADRRRYVLYAKVRRRPQVVRVDVPDEDVPVYLKSGFVLVN